MAIRGTSFAALAAALLLASAPAVAATIDFDGESYPCISFNIKEAVGGGHVSTLSRITSKEKISQHRTEACGHAKALVKRLNELGGPGTPASCDEYPFASSKEGGKGAHILIVPLLENKSQGGTLKTFYEFNEIENGDTYDVSTSNVPPQGSGKGEIVIKDHDGIEQCYYGK